MSKDKSARSDDVSKEHKEAEGNTAQQAIEKISERKPEVLSEMMAMFGTGPMVNPLHQKMDGEHIAAALGLAADHDERQFELYSTSQQNEAAERKSNRRYLFAGFLVLIGVVIFVLVQFEDQPELLVPILTGIGGLVGGFLGGWGYGRANA